MRAFTVGLRSVRLALELTLAVDIFEQSREAR
jgi:hypothetical protein